MGSRPLDLDIPGSAVPVGSCTLSAHRGVRSFWTRFWSTKGTHDTLSAHLEVTGANAFPSVPQEKGERHPPNEIVEHAVERECPGQGSRPERLRHPKRPEHFPEETDEDDRTILTLGSTFLIGPNDTRSTIARRVPRHSRYTA